VSKESALLLQIHDELLLEVPDRDIERVTEFVVDRMVGAMDLAVPLKVDAAVGKNWEESK
jgi:DNA polymerase-1